jgi:hypothetical protein
MDARRGARGPRLAGACLAAGAALLPVGCSAAAGALGPSPQAARERGTQLVGALADRFGPVRHDAAFAALRPRFARAALVPSRVFDDGEAWHRQRQATREVDFRGASDGDGYRLGVASDPRPPVTPGEYRGTLALEALRPGEFEWRML